MTPDPPGPLIGAGRSADIYAVGSDRVLRRFRTEYDSAPEAEIMVHLAGNGFPVPKVYDVQGRDLVMERLDGRDMLDDLGRRPWLARQHARLLASLHDRLHEISAPGGMRSPLGDGDRVMHLDLHPGNVMLTSRGPVVIDWTNASRGPGGADVAMAYVIMASSEVDTAPVLMRPAIRTVRAAVLRHFRAAVRDDLTPHLATVARERIKDRNVRPDEAEFLRRMAEQAERSAGAS